MAHYNSLREYFAKTNFTELEAPCFALQENIDELTKRLDNFAWSCKDVIRESADALYASLWGNCKTKPSLGEGYTRCSLGTFNAIIKGIDMCRVPVGFSSRYGCEITYNPDSFPDVEQLYDAERIIFKFIEYCGEQFIPVRLVTPVGIRNFPCMGSNFARATAHAFEKTRVRFSQQIYHALHFTAMYREFFNAPIDLYTECLRIVYDEMIRGKNDLCGRPYFESVLNPPVIDPQIADDNVPAAEFVGYEEDESLATALDDLKLQSQELSQLILSSKCILTETVSGKLKTELVYDTVDLIISAISCLSQTLLLPNVAFSLRDEYCARVADVGTFDGIIKESYPVSVSDIIRFTASVLGVVNTTINVVEQTGWRQPIPDVQRLPSKIHTMLTLIRHAPADNTTQEKKEGNEKMEQYRPVVIAEAKNVLEENQNVRFDIRKLIESSPLAFVRDSRTGQITEVLKDRKAKHGEKRELTREDLAGSIEILVHTAKELDTPIITAEQQCAASPAINFPEKTMDWPTIDAHNVMEHAVRLCKGAEVITAATDSIRVNDFAIEAALGTKEWFDKECAEMSRKMIKLANDLYAIEIMDTSVFGKYGYGAIINYSTDPFIRYTLSVVPEYCIPRWFNNGMVGTEFTNRLHNNVMGEGTDCMRAYLYISWFCYYIRTTRQTIVNMMANAEKLNNFLKDEKKEGK